MISLIFSFFIVVCISLFPIYLWGYGVTRFFGDAWSRWRFWLGICMGAISVGLLFVLSHTDMSNVSFFLGVMGVFFLFLYGIIYLLTGIGSPFARGFLRKVTLIHMVIIVIITTGISYCSYRLTGSIMLSLLALPLLVSALFEEASKHLSTLGLAGADFRFSRRELVSFTFFVVLGFVCIENLLYLWIGGFSLGVWISRSLFALSIHLLAASICTYAWWRALSYRLFSWQYILIFSLGFLTASLVHALYNYALQSGHGLLIMGVGFIMSYIVFTRLMLPDRERKK